MYKYNKEKSNQIWQNIRKRGELFNFDKLVPATCPCGICDNYPWVDLCITCNPYKVNKVKDHP
tara:strand:- start:3178 stop:3366 length:189 start_codon:yes stop_codon:yes gene_type:complete